MSIATETQDSAQVQQNSQQPPLLSAEKSAGWSWRLPVAAIGASIVIQLTGLAQSSGLPPSVMGLLNITAAVVGFGLAISAICRCSGKPWKEVVVPATAGLIVNGALLTLFAVILRSIP